MMLYGAIKKFKMTNTGHWSLVVSTSLYRSHMWWSLSLLVSSLWRPPLIFSGLYRSSSISGDLNGLFYSLLVSRDMYPLTVFMFISSSLHWSLWRSYMFSSGFSGLFCMGRSILVLWSPLVILGFQ